MRLQVHILRIVVGLLIGALGPSVASAGFIAASGDLNGGVQLIGAKPLDPAPRAPAPNNPPQDDQSFESSSGYLPTAGSMQSSGGIPGGGVVAAVLPIEEVSASELVQRLDPSGRVWLPPRFLLGIFRPPRA